MAKLAHHVDMDRPLIDIEKPLPVRSADALDLPSGLIFGCAVSAAVWVGIIAAVVF